MTPAVSQKGQNLDACYFFVLAKLLYPFPMRIAVYTSPWINRPFLFTTIFWWYYSKTLVFKLLCFLKTMNVCSDVNKWVVLLHPQQCGDVVTTVIQTVAMMTDSMCYEILTVTCTVFLKQLYSFPVWRFDLWLYCFIRLMCVFWIGGSVGDNGIYYYKVFKWILWRLCFCYVREGGTDYVK